MAHLWYYFLASHRSAGNQDVKNEKKLKFRLNGKENEFPTISLIMQSCVGVIAYINCYRNIHSIFCMIIINVALVVLITSVALILL